MRLNGCHNRPEGRPTYPAQDGYFEDSFPDGTPLRSPKWVLIQDRAMSKDCRYSLHTDDPGCTGCRHNQWGRTPIVSAP